MKKTLTFVYPDGLKTAHSRMYDAGFIHKFQKWGSLRKEECLNFTIWIFSELKYADCYNSSLHISNYSVDEV